MLKRTPPGAVHSTTDSGDEMPMISPPDVVRSEAARATSSDTSKTPSPNAQARSPAESLDSFDEKSAPWAPHQMGAQAPKLLASASTLPKAPNQKSSRPPDICAPSNLPATHKRLINTVCAAVATELRQTVGWDIKINEDLQVHSIDRSTLRGLLQKDYHINAFQAWVLTRVLGVAYLPSMKKVVIVEEVTRSWHPELLAHEVAKGVVRLSLGLYANREAGSERDKALHFEDKLDQLYSVDYQYRRGVRAMAAFHQAHAESIARKHQPTGHTAPVRQKLWGVLVYFFMYSYFEVRAAGRQLADNFERILNKDFEWVNLIYDHGRMTELLHGGVGKVHIDSATKQTQGRLKQLGDFLYSLNPHRGSVVAQINLGSTRAFSRDD